MIVETEAYSQEEEACHGYNKKTHQIKYYLVNQEDFIFIDHTEFIIV